jgi:hypothetical protein
VFFSNIFEKKHFTLKVIPKKANIGVLTIVEGGKVFILIFLTRVLVLVEIKTKKKNFEDKKFSHYGFSLIAIFLMWLISMNLS